MEQLNDHNEVIVATLSLKTQTNWQQQQQQQQQNRLHMPKIQYTQSYIK